MLRPLGLLLTAFVATLIACSSSSDGTGEPSPEVAFCNAVGDSLSRCAGASTSCSALTADCSKLTSLLSPSLLSAATTCMKAATCDGGGPLSCLGSSLGNITPTAAQEQFASDYCNSCSVISGDACASAFYPSGGSAGLGTLLLPFGDSLVGNVDSDCTSSSLGKTVCQSSFSTCVSASAAKALATSISADSASCLVSAIQAGISNIGNSDGGTGDDDAASGEGGGPPPSLCNNVLNNAPVIVSDNLTGAAPAATGGAITDGTYYLNSVKTYATEYQQSTFKATIVFSNGNHFDDVAVQDGILESESGIYTAVGTTFTRSFSCPSAEPALELAYSADASTFAFYDETGTILYTYVKQ